MVDKKKAEKKVEVKVEKKDAPKKFGVNYVPGFDASKKEK